MKYSNYILFLSFICLFLNINSTAGIKQNSGVANFIPEAGDYRIYKSNEIEYTIVLDSHPYGGAKYYSGNTLLLQQGTKYLYYDDVPMEGPVFDPDIAIVGKETRRILTDNVILGVLLKELPDSLRSKAESFDLTLFLRNDGVILTLSIKPKFKDGAGLCYDAKALQRIADHINQYRGQLAWNNTDIALEASYITFCVETAGKDIKNILEVSPSDTIASPAFLYDCHVYQKYYYTVKLDAFNTAVLRDATDSMSVKAKSIAGRSIDESVLWNKLMELIPSETKSMLDGLYLETIVKNDGSVVFARIVANQACRAYDGSDEYRWERTYGPCSFVSLDCFPKSTYLQELIMWMNTNKIFTAWKKERDIDAEYVHLEYKMHSESYYVKREIEHRRYQEERANRRFKKDEVSLNRNHIFTNIITDTLGDYSVKIDTVSGHRRFFRCVITKKSEEDKVKQMYDGRFNGNKFKEAEASAKYNMDLNGILNLLTKNIPDTLKRYISIYNFHCTSTKKPEVVNLQFDLFFNTDTLTKTPIFYSVEDCYRLIKEFNENGFIKPWEGDNELVKIDKFVHNDERLNELNRKYQKRCFDRDKAKSLLKSAGKISTNEEQ